MGSSVLISRNPAPTGQVKRPHPRCTHRSFSSQPHSAHDQSASGHTAGPGAGGLAHHPLNLECQNRERGRAAVSWAGPPQGLPYISEARPSPFICVDSSWLSEAASSVPVSEAGHSGSMSGGSRLPEVQSVTVRGWAAGLPNGRGRRWYRILCHCPLSETPIKLFEPRAVPGQCLALAAVLCCVAASLGGPCISPALSTLLHLGPWVQSTEWPWVKSLALKYVCFFFF